MQRLQLQKRGGEGLGLEEWKSLGCPRCLGSWALNGEGLEAQSEDLAVQGARDGPLPEKWAEGFGSPVAGFLAGEEGAGALAEGRARHEKKCSDPLEVVLRRGDQRTLSEVPPV